MRTFVVRLDPHPEWMGNAESPEEAVAYAVAKTNVILPSYTVFDWNLDLHVVVVGREGQA